MPCDTCVINLILKEAVEMTEGTGGKCGGPGDEGSEQLQEDTGEHLAAWKHLEELRGLISTTTMMEPRGTDGPAAPP